MIELMQIISANSLISKTLQADILYIKELENYMRNTFIRMYNGHIIVVVLMHKYDSK